MAGCDANEPVVFGVVLGSGFMDAARLAVDDEAALGGLPPFDTIMIMEGSNRAGPAIEAAQQVTVVPGIVAVIGHSNSAASLATSQIYNDVGVVQLAPTSTAPIYSEAGPFSFRMVPPDQAQGAFLAQTLSDSLPGPARIAVLYVNDDYGRGLRGTFLERLDLERFQVVLDLPHTEGDVEELDLEHQVGAVISSDPAAIVWLGRVAGLTAVLPRFREGMDPNLPVFAGDAAARASLMTEREPWWNGVMYADFVDLDATPELREFRDRFRARFPTEPGSAEALAYDAAGVVLAAIRSGARSGNDVKSYLESLGRERPPHPGVTGPVEFGPQGDADRTYVLLRVEPTG